MSLHIEKLSVQLGGQKILEDLSLAVKAGEIFTVLGPSGVGKTTLLKALAGLIPSTAQKLTLGGQDLKPLPTQKRPLAFVFQDLRLFPHLTVFSNITFPMKMQGFPKTFWPERVQTLLAEVKLQGFENREIASLSGGQQQRVAIARALAQEPELLLLDEPFSSLDEALRLEMRELLTTLRDKHQLTCLLITHDKNEAVQVSDRLAILSSQGLEQVGTPRELLLEPKNLTVAQYFGAVNVLKGVVKNGEFQGAFTLPVAPQSPQQQAGLAWGILRPDHLSLKGAGQAWQVTERLQQVEFAQVTVQKGTELLCVTLPPQAAFTVGDWVGVHCEPEAIWCLPRT